MAVYRGTRPDEQLSPGLIAKDPKGNTTVAEHIRHGSHTKKGSPYISTTSNLDIAKKYTQGETGGRVVKIKLEDVPSDCKIIDLNDSQTREKELGKNPIAKNFAKHDHEVLLDCGSTPVPCKCIKQKVKQ